MIGFEEIYHKCKERYVGYKGRELCMSCKTKLGKH